MRRDLGFGRCAKGVTDYQYEEKLGYCNPCKARVAEEDSKKEMNEYTEFGEYRW
jgi:hypothetical protein